jgi:signal transduction histidine kinase
VLDEGRGVPESERERIFTRFYQVDGSRTRTVGGAGLGLAIARAIVAAHGGRIWVEAREKGGSAFVMALPPLVASGAAVQAV